MQLDFTCPGIKLPATRQESFTIAELRTAGARQKSSEPEAGCSRRRKLVPSSIPSSGRALSSAAFFFSDLQTEH
jgi:hypothetical protein